MRTHLHAFDRSHFNLEDMRRPFPIAFGTCSTASPVTTRCGQAGRARPRDSLSVATEDDVRRLAMALPRTTERPCYGTPGFRVADRLFARIHEEQDVLVLWCGDVRDKDILIGAEPNKFFTTPHYDGHASVLLRLSAVNVEELADLLSDAWRALAPRRLVAAFDARSP